MGKIFNALEKSVKSEKITEQGPPLLQSNEPPSEQAGIKISSDGSSYQAESSDNMFARLSSDLVVALKPQSVEAEQFRNLKNNILFPEKGNPPKTIMVTSTIPGDGKSFVASNLAISIAQSIDEYVLLMDCDLRASSLGSLFGFTDVNGLSEYLTKAMPFSALLQNTFLEKLKVLPAGHTPKNPSELLTSEQMRKLIHEVKLRYNDRYIILDTPPPYITSETSALARQVDGVILVVRQRKSKKQDIHDIIDIYGREKILGIVYNDANTLLPYGSSKYGYGKYGYGNKKQ
ncbi:MAG: polysaccharide biosynthesis tyrosine autokinase [Pseudomonadota bacterium]